MKNLVGSKFLRELQEYPIYLFAPYLLLYLVGWAFKIPILYVEKGFWAFHLINVFSLVMLLVANAKQIKWFEWFFWMGLFLLLWNRGAYLEYPSDTWDHFKRITIWNDYSFISENPYKARISYFFGWTFLRYFEPIEQRSFLHFYSASWQWLLSYQFARLFLKLNIERERIIPYVVGTLVLFGSGMIGFRYYMLSGVPLGYISYLSALGICLSEIKVLQAPVIIRLLALCCLMLMGHPETFLFFAISIAALFCTEYLFNSKNARQRLSFAAGVYIFSLFIGYLLFYFKFYPFSKYHYAEHWTAQLSRLSTFRLWDLNGRIFETLGIAGLVSVLASPFVIKKNPRVAVLSLFPIFLLVFPLSVLLIVTVFNMDTAYRVLYSFPLSVLSVLLIEQVIFRIALKKMPAIFITCFLILLVSSPYKYPWRGRLFFLLHRPKADRTLLRLDETAQWFFDNRKEMPRYCHIFSDDLSTFSLYTHLGRRPHGYDRAHPLNEFKRDNYNSVFEKERFIGFQEAGRTICGLLCIRKEEVPPPSYSIVSIEGKLWPPQRGDVNDYVSSKVHETAEKLLNRGWTKTRVPPFYDLYEPPYLSDLPPPIHFTNE